MNQVVVGCVLCGASGLVWMGLFRLARRLLTQHCRAKSWDISAHHVLNMSEAIVSSLQAVASSVCGVMVVAACRHDVMGAVHPLASWYAWVAGSYFIYDTVAMYKVLVYRSGVGDFFVGCFYCVELSGPFTNMRVVLSRLGLKTSRWYTVNGILMIISFALCRVALFPYMYWAYGAQYGLSVPQVVRAIPVHCNLGSLLVLLPQLHWLRLMVLGAVKVSQGAPITEADEKID